MYGKCEYECEWECVFVYLKQQSTKKQEERK